MKAVKIVASVAVGIVGLWSGSITIADKHGAQLSGFMLWTAENSWWIFPLASLVFGFIVGWLARGVEAKREMRKLGMTVEEAAARLDEDSPEGREIAEKKIREALAGMDWKDLDRLKRLYAEGELSFIVEFNPDELAFVRSGMAYWLVRSGMPENPLGGEHIVKMEPEWRSRIGLNYEFFESELENARKKSSEAINRARRQPPL